eukprot:12889289-Prorocentrum_lima.AAC.1
MQYKEVKVDQPGKRTIVWKKFDHDLTPPKDVGFRWIGSTWFRVRRVNSQLQALSVGNLEGNTIRRALMSDL